jgi:predicted subunit of tRNA(5-methylaminomethyl-2-thiouridylate) methyltransferase
VRDGDKLTAWLREAADEIDKAHAVLDQAKVPRSISDDGVECPNRDQLPTQAHHMRDQRRIHQHLAARCVRQLYQAAHAGLRRIQRLPHLGRRHADAHLLAAHNVDLALHAAKRTPGTRSVRC